MGGHCLAMILAWFLARWLIALQGFFTAFFDSFSTSCYTMASQAMLNMWEQVWNFAPMKNPFEQTFDSLWSTNSTAAGTGPQAHAESLFMSASLAMMFWVMRRA